MGACNMEGDMTNDRVLLNIHKAFLRLFLVFISTLGNINSYLWGNGHTWGKDKDRSKREDGLRGD